MKNRIYCSQCIYFISNLSTTAECAYSENIITEYKDDWYSKREETTYARKPYNINYRNNCEWFALITIPKDKGFSNLQ